MFQIIDKELKIIVLVSDDKPNTYYLSYQGNSKCVIDTKIIDNNMIIMPTPQGECTVDELNIIIDKFNSFIFSIKPELNGILLNTDPTPRLEQIGFKLLNDDSEYLFKENERTKKVK